MRPRLPYWISPLRFGHDSERGPFIAVDLAKEHKAEKHTMKFFDRDFDGKTPQERSKIVAASVVEKAKELGFIPGSWQLG